MGFTPHTKGLKMDKSILGSVTFAPAGEKVRPKVTGLKNGHRLLRITGRDSGFFQVVRAAN